ncbi:MAG TPA: tol-pal system protein YbgF [Candidatus Cybelea sp.]|nr:tol-pal system protein YbgF [Candidatus Cybelea sp.]
MMAVQISCAGPRSRPVLFSARVRSILFAAILLAGTASAVAPARADEIDDLRQQIQQLQQQVTYLQNQIPGAGAGGATGGGTIAAQQVVQMQQMSQQMSQLQGQIEQLGIKLDDLSSRVDRAQKDTEFRLGRLEGGGAAGAPATMGANTGAPAGASLGASAAPAATAGAAASAIPASPAPLPSSAAEMTVDGSAGAPQQLSSGQSQAATNQGPTAPGTLGTLTQEQAANLPQAPAGAAEAAAAAAAQTPMPTTPSPSQDPNNIVLPGNTPQDQYNYAFGLLQRSAYAEAELAFKAFVAQHPKDPLAGNAQYWLGETYYARSDYQNAAIVFAQGYQKYPKSPKAPDNLLKLGMTLGQIGQKDNACTAFKQLAKDFPNASASIKDRAARAQQRYGCTS